MRYIVNRSYRWRSEVDEIDVGGRCRQMTMGVDETRQHCAAAKLDDPSVLLMRLTQLVTTHGDDTIVFDKYRFGKGPSRIHGDDAAHIERGCGEGGLERGCRHQQRGR